MYLYEGGALKNITSIGTLCLLSATLVATPVQAYDGDEDGKVVTLIHTGDFHGHLVPRPNMRSDAIGNSREGGLARIATIIKKIRADDKNALLLNTGDTIQGSAEVLYTRGQAIVDVLNKFGIDAFAPGNWDFVYGTQRFLELFAGPAPQAPWNAVAANAYYTTTAEDPTTPYPDKGGQRVLPPYLIKQIGKVKVGILGFTTNRGPQVVGSSVTKGFRFTNGDAEVAQLLPVLRNVEKVDLVVMISELGLANNIRLSEANPGIDVILSSDMHEETKEAVVTSTGTIVVEEGQDGTMMGKLKLMVKNGKVVKWTWKAYNVTDDVEEDEAVAADIANVRKTFVSGPDFVQHVNPLNGSRLKRPIDTVVGYTMKALHRSNFSQEDMPGVIEGSSHDFLTDAFRVVAGAQIGAIRGFRYGTHVAPGAIKMEDLYHYVAIGPQIAKGVVRGQAVKNQIENAASGSLDPNVAAWTGGWLFNFSGVTMDVDVYKPNGQRASNIQVNGVPINLTGNYTYASYWYASDPCLINVIPIPGCTAPGGVPSNITILKDDDGSPMDGTEVVVKYLQLLPNQTADTQLNRIRVLAPLPAPKFGNPEVQPLRGATP